ncbi:MAG: hypothetical protein ACRDHO_12465 [Actinomycetota bacterium]
MVIAVFLMLLGALGPIAAVQWWSGRWLPAARWIARNSSAHVLYATPVAGVFVGCLGLSIIWPPAIVLVFLSAGAFVLALLASPDGGRSRSAGATEPAAASPRRVTAPRRSRSRPTQVRRDTRRAG